jgi:hypothetical protein
MSARRRRLEILVDEVVVRGLSPAQVRSAVAALEARLQLLGEGWAASGMAIAARDESFRRAPVATPATSSPAAVGESAASSIWAVIASGDRQ